MKEEGLWGIKTHLTTGKKTWDFNLTEHQATIIDLSTKIIYQSSTEPHTVSCSEEEVGKVVLTFVVLVLVLPKPLALTLTPLLGSTFVGWCLTEGEAGAKMSPLHCAPAVLVLLAQPRGRQGRCSTTFRAPQIYCSQPHIARMEICRLQVKEDAVDSKEGNIKMAQHTWMGAAEVINFKCWPLIIIKLYSLQKPLWASSKELLRLIGFGGDGGNSKHLHINYIFVMVCSSAQASQAEAASPQMQLPATTQLLCPILSAHRFGFLSPSRMFAAGH